MERVHSLAAVLVALLASCGTTDAVLKRSAQVPAAYLPSRTGMPLKDLEVRVQAEANPIRLRDGHDPIAADLRDEVRVGDPGLLIPQAEIGGSVYFAPIRYLEIGGQLHWASMRWTRGNRAGVLDFPAGQGMDVWQGGFGIRGNGTVQRVDLTFSPILEVNFVRVPEAEFVRPSLAYPGQGYPETEYRYTGKYTSLQAYPAFFIQVDKGFLDSTLHVHVLVGVERTLTNVGFDWEDRRQTTVRTAAALVVGAGVEYRYRWFVVGATLFYPMADGEDLETGTFGPSLALRMGVVLGGRVRPAPVPAPAVGEAP